MAAADTVRVAVEALADRPERAFSYRLPPELGAPAPGSLLLVPYGRRLALGYLLPGTPEPEPEIELRSIEAVVHDHWYGTPVDQVRGILAAGRDAILTIDPQGARSVRALVPDALLIFIMPPSIEDLDQRLAAALAEGPLTEATYADAYLRSATPREREYQIELIDAVGHRLDALVKKPLVGRTLKLMRHPARVAGLSDLQDFLERGFEAFRQMRGADEFLQLLRQRELEIARRLFSGEPEPFSV